MAFRDRLLAFIPALAPAEKVALLAIAAVLAAGGLLRAWERSGVALGPVDDWESLRALIVRSQHDLAQGREGRDGNDAGGYACADDGLPGFSAGDGGRGDAERILAAGMVSFKRGKSAGGKKTPPARPVDLNAASEKTLLALPGVGPSTAKAIVAWRAAQGRFRTVDDLMQVKGIGPKKMEALRPHVRVAASADSAAPP
jgi:competence ComEA-like helix-hairpin-helix protein